MTILVRRSYGRNEYQVNSFNSVGELIHCGPHGIGRLTRKTVQKLERKWRCWRVSTGRPLQRKKDRATTIVVYPVMNPKTVHKYHF